MDTRADNQFFVNRSAELDQVLTACRAGLNSLVTAERGMGRTSFLRQAQLRLRATSTVAVYLDASGFTDAGDLMTAVRERVMGPRVTYTRDIDRMMEKAIGRRVVSWSGDGSLLHEIDVLREGLTTRDEDSDGEPVLGSERFEESTVVLLDQPVAAAAHAIFGRLRDELWGLPLVWVVTVDASRRATLLRPPADAFFERRIELQPLSHADAGALLRLRTGDHPLNGPTLEWLIRAGSGEPRRLITLARKATERDGATVAEIAAGRDAFDRQIRDLPASARAVVDALRARGGSASASDPDLIADLGWTRARVAQVFRQLSEEGIVTGQSASESGRPGRPRTVYTLVEAAL